MSLDQNLFTLTITPGKDDPSVTDLVDPEGTTHYRKKRVPDAGYKAAVYDPITDALLIVVSAPSATSKHKTLELCNPAQVVELRYTGTLAFRWGFSWEGHDFEWKREECFMLRKPDPPVLVAVTKSAVGRLKTSTVQILDYNLNRFDIEDRKGLEIVMLTALLSFQDSNEAHHAPPDSTTPSTPSIAAPLFGLVRKSSSQAALPPTPTPVMLVPPPLLNGVDHIAELQAQQGDYNEVTVSEEGIVVDYAQYCLNLLQDSAMLFITVRSSAPEHVPKVLQVVEETKRLRHKAGLSDDHELHQYVLYDTDTNVANPRRRPRRINLDDAPDKGKTSNAYKPPASLTVHLSTIPMPELQPKPAIPPRKAVTVPPRAPSPQPKDSAAARKAEKEAEKKRKQAEKEAAAARKREGKKPVRDPPAPPAPAPPAPIPSLAPQNNRLSRAASATHLRIYPEYTTHSPSPSPMSAYPDKPHAEIGWGHAPPRRVPSPGWQPHPEQWEGWQPHPREWGEWQPPPQEWEQHQWAQGGGQGRGWGHHAARSASGRF